MTGLRWSQQQLDDYLSNRRGRGACTGAPLALVQPSPAGSDDAGMPHGADAFRARSEMEKRRVGAYEDEDDLQIATADFLDLALPDNARWFHVPNGGKRGKAEAGRFKAMGVKPGVGDVIVLFGPIYIMVEMKTATGSLSPEQREWRAFCRSVGAPWKLCRSVLEVEDFLRSCGLPLKATLR